MRCVSAGGGLVSQPPPREELKSHFVTREGTYRLVHLVNSILFYARAARLNIFQRLSFRLMTLAEYSRPNRVPMNQVGSTWMRFKAHFQGSCLAHLINCSSFLHWSASLFQMQPGNAMCCAPVRVSFLSVNTNKPGEIKFLKGRSLAKILSLNGEI